MSTAKDLLKKDSEDKKKLITERRELIISAVQRNEIIWNKCLQEHKDNVAVDAAWDNVCQSTGFAKALAKKEWKYLRDQFRNNLTLVKVKKSGDGYDPEKDFDKVKWPYFRQMLFLKDIIAKRDTSCNIKENNEDVDSQAKNGDEAHRILSSLAVGGEDMDDEREQRSETPAIDIGSSTAETPSTSSTADMPSTSSTADMPSTSSRPQSSASSSFPSCSSANTTHQKRRKGQNRSTAPNEDDIDQEIDKIDKLAEKLVASAENRSSSEDAADRFGKYIADILRRVKPKKQKKFELTLIQSAFSFISDSDSE